ncbi:MAG: family 16 glycoside hydrolase [Planctomycetota bacterium]
MKETRPLLAMTMKSSLLILAIPSIAQAESPDLHAAGSWQTVSGESIDQNWEFTDGEIRLVKPQGFNGSILSAPLPPNFELSFEWKIEAGTNTGVKYRVRRFGDSMFNNRHLGIEYQIIDEAKTKPGTGSTAAIYDLVAPLESKSVRPIGQWNSAKIVAIGNRVEHHLNGQLVASTRTDGPVWDRQMALSKFYGADGFGKPRMGDRIMLTDHGGKAAYRNFQFVAKQPNAADQDTIKRQAPFLANAMRNSWADQDSIVIWTRTTAHPSMLMDGKRFLSLSTGQARKLANERDPKKLMEAQLPKNATLSEMFGACPGHAGQVKLSYFPGKRRDQVKSTEWITTKAESDFTAQWKLENLQPDTQYATIIEARSVNGESTKAVVRGAFRTAPAVNATKAVDFCVTTCHDFIRRDDGMNGHKLYPAMTKMNPDFIVHAGDIEYYDKPDPWALTVELMRFKWGRIFSLPSNRSFYQNTTSYFLKDDHDTLKNDCWAGQMYGSVSFEQGVQIFNEEQFPSRSPRYQTVQWGKDLQVWFLEGRDYRSPNNIADGPEKTILGRTQKEWLFETLKESTAKFRLIFSPTPIVGPDRDNKRDNHANDVFAHEGAEIRSQLEQLENTIVLCGDRHWQYASFDPATDLWEFGCGPGSEKHQLGWKPGDERPLHQFLRVKGGFLSGQLQYVGKNKTPKLTIRHHKVTGEPVSEFIFPQEDR